MTIEELKVTMNNNHDYQWQHVLTNTEDYVLLRNTTLKYYRIDPKRATRINTSYLATLTESQVLNLIDDGLADVGYDRITIDHHRMDDWQTGATTAEVLLTLGGRVDVLKNGTNKIAVDLIAVDKYYDVWIMDNNPELSNKVNLTSGLSGVDQKHNGQPCWHPGGNYIIFQSQVAEVPDQYDPDCDPGSGAFNRLVLMKADGSQAWTIPETNFEYDEPTTPPGSLHPKFNSTGTKLAWANRRQVVGSSSLGAWEIKIADFDVNNPSNPLSNIQTFAPGQANPLTSMYFYETHGFTADGSKLIYTSDYEGPLDIYMCNATTGLETDQLTTSWDWDEHAAISPDGTKIVWMSSQDVRYTVSPFFLQTEWWIMDIDGLNKTRLTYFHDSSHPDYRDDLYSISVPSDLSWEQDGSSFLGLIIHGAPGTTESGVGELVRVTIPSSLL